MKSAQLLLALLVAIGTVFTFTAPNAVGFQNPDLARIVFWHLPCALSTAVFIFAAAYFSLRYLQTRDEAWDQRALAANEITAITGVLTLVTGMLFSKEQWGAWWNWDPRQTSFLFAMLFVAAYFALRSAFDDPSKRANNSAAYNLAAVLPLVFLIFVFPRLPMVQSLHPDFVREGGGMSGQYRTVFLSMFALFLMVCVTVYRLKVRASLLELALDKSHGELANRNHPTTARVVRPVSVSESDRQEGPGA